MQFLKDGVQTVVPQLNGDLKCRQDRGLKPHSYKRHEKPAGLSIAH